MKKLNKETDPRAYKMLKKNKDLRCSFCPPHDGENKGKQARDDKRKNKRRQ